MNAMKTTLLAFLTTLALGLAASEATVSGQNMELFMKWAAAEIVHYDVVGEYSAPTVILDAAGGLPGGKGRGVDRVVVKDRFEASFDWGPVAGLVGRPVFSVQHHPEASPGPQDSHYLFRRFLNMVREKKGEPALAER